MTVRAKPQQAFITYLLGVEQSVPCGSVETIVWRTIQRFFKSVCYDSCDSIDSKLYISYLIFFQWSVLSDLYYHQGNFRPAASVAYDRIYSYRSGVSPLSWTETGLEMALAVFSIQIWIKTSPSPSPPHSIPTFGTPQFPCFQVLGSSWESWVVFTFKKNESTHIYLMNRPTQLQQ